MIALAALLLAPALPAQSTDAFVNWETPQVHPLELTADGATLLAVNTADNRLLVFDVSGPEPALLAAVPVGLEPVSVRARVPGEAWVVNHVSDSISVVDLTTLRVAHTLRTADEPCDVVFAGTPQRAFVSCSQVNLIQVFDVALPDAAPIDVPVYAEDPRALAVSADGQSIYAAVFESGNATTILGGPLDLGGPTSYPPDAVGEVGGPYAGMNPPPNAGALFDPPLAPGLATAPEVGLIVKRDGQGNWFDDNGGDWTRYVTGDRAALSGRKRGWDVLDRDVVKLDVGTLNVTYESGLMNLCMSLAVRPDGRLAVIGTDARNHVRFEPNLNGRFATVELALVDPSGTQTVVRKDLNPHLDYQSSSVPAAQRLLSIGDPRAVVWSSDGAHAWVAGMGSNNVVRLDAAGDRAGAGQPIGVGAGPTGLALDEAHDRLYVLQRFDASVGVIDLSSDTLLTSVPFFDPTPDVIRAGRRFLYDTQLTSGTGHLSCATCHADARMDRLAWDLGDPAGAVVPFDGNCRDGQCEDWHPMKGPFLTQTLQDIIGKEPHHWRGDRAGIEAFNPAFEGLLGDDAQLTAQEMQAFEDFLATIHFPPNPFRALDNTLPTNLPLIGHYRTGRFGNEGQPLPNGNAQNGLALYLPPNFLDGTSCANCHALPTGMGTDYAIQGNQFVPIPPGPNGERHHSITSGDGSSQKNTKIPQLRNLHERVGHDATQLESSAGFGFLHDGTVDSIARFVAEPAFGVQSDQEVADLVAFLLCLAGSDLPEGSTANLLVPPGSASLDSHAAVGAQATLVDAALAPQALLDRLDTLEGLAGAGAVELVVKGRIAGQARGWLYEAGAYQSDRAVETHSAAALRGLAALGGELTWTSVPNGSGVRIGLDRDLDGAFDRDELDAGSDPADADDRPLGARYCNPAVPNSTGFPGRLDVTGSDALAVDSLRLTASDLPLDSFGYFLVSRDPGLTLNAGGSDGHLCLAGSIGRFNQVVGNTGAEGRFALDVNLAQLPQPNGFVGVQPGDTWSFQCWYRDLGGATNLTDAVSVVFQ